jgi:hypothetical protein
MTTTPNLAKSPTTGGVTSETESRILVFKGICNFIKDLTESFGSRQKSLMLYSHLVEKTGIMHEEPIKKHVSLFYHFVKMNEEAILAKDEKQFAGYTIFYSEKVGVNLEEIFEWADREEKNAIFKHLLALLALLDPSSHAKELLKKEMENKKKKGEEVNEEKFLKNIIDKVSSEMDTEVENPMQLMTKMMTSGVFKDIVEDMNSSFSEGNLDMGKMMNTMQMIMGNLGTMMGGAGNGAVNSGGQGTGGGNNLLS